jgi:hypothetical protein
MGRLLIYPDSHMWDALYDQHVDPKSMIDALAAKNATLVLSYHVVFEIAKIFLRLHPGRDARGIALFSYLKQFVDMGIPETKQVSELLTAEAYALENDLSEIDPFATVEESAISNQEIAKLASGLVEDRVKEYIPRRIKHAEETRDKQIAHLMARPKVKTSLLAIKKQDSMDGFVSTRCHPLVLRWFVIECTQCSGPVRLTTMLLRCCSLLRGISHAASSGPISITTGAVHMEIRCRGT